LISPSRDKKQSPETGARKRDEKWHASWWSGGWSGLKLRQSTRVSAKNNGLFTKKSASPSRLYADFTKTAHITYDLPAAHLQTEAKKSI
jgi:hypothetical protein